jgi:periplasmic divalent cation tolerance protein
MTNAIQVTTAAGSQEEARRIARGLVERRLAACVHVLGPIESLYHWEGRIEQSQEWLCVAKTSLDRYAQVEAAIRELHSYQVPEILAVPVVAGSRAYLDWLEAELAPRPADPG